MARTVLILGCGRSGTSIFGEMFESISNFTYFSEPEFDDLIHLAIKDKVAVKVPRESHLFPCDEGLSVNMEAVREYLPHPIQLYWIIRHPLDTIASLKVGISKNWGHHPRPPDWKKWLSKPLILRCAHHWNYLNSVGYAQIQETATVKYFEDLITNPKSFCHSICAEIGIQVHQNPGLILWMNRVQNENNAHFIEAATSRPYSTSDHHVRIGRWKENLTDEEVHMVMPVIKKTAQRFGYM